MHISKHIALLSIVCTSLLHTLYAQVLPYRHYTTNDELANSNVYAVFQDRTGYIWSATERGLSRFDGYKFTNYLYKEGLPDNIIYSITEDDSGHLWFGTKFHGICKYDDGKFLSIIPDTTGYTGYNQIKNQGNLFYCLRKFIAIHVIDTLTPNQKSIIKFSDNVTPNCIFKTSGKKILAGCSDGLYELNNTVAHKLNIPDFENMPVFAISENKSVLCVAAGKHIYFLKNNTVVKTIAVPPYKNDNINSLLIDKDNHLWIGTYPGKSFYYYDSVFTDLTNKINLNGASVNDIIQDTEGNIWAGIYSNGLFCFHHLYCTNYSLADGLINTYITALNADSSRNIFVGTYNGLSVFNGTSFTNIKLFINEPEFIRDISFFNNMAFIANTASEIPKENIITTNYNSDILKMLHTNSICAIDDTIQYIGRWDGNIYKINTAQKTMNQLEQIKLSNSNLHFRINKIFHSKNNELFCATNNGLYIIHRDNTIEKPDNGILSSPINVIVADNEGNIWVGAQQGIAILKNNSWDFIQTLKNKILESVTTIVFDNENRAWIGTQTGLFFTDSNKNIVEFNAHNGLISDEINALFYDDKKNTIWVGTSAGLSKININQFENTAQYPAQVILRNIKTADSVFRIADNNDIRLSYKNNNFTLRFSALHFSDPEGIKFQYKLDALPWAPASGRMIEFASLGYGKHTISVKSISDQGIEGPLASLNITVVTPFWASLWFKILIGILLCTLIYILIKQRFESEKKKQNERIFLNNKISELRQQALTSSMNPHFIFNALNSIQEFINTHNTEEASEYLGKFSRLIRMILEAGGKSFISLDKELDRLNYYLELEKIRFGNKLTYSISIDKNIDIRNTEIPNMIIQPFVENALWHGILSSQKNGNISIRFTKDSTHRLKIYIDDNGIGINESKRRKKNDHNSLSLSMINERMQLLNKLNNQQSGIIITDKTDLNTSDTGTLIEITL